MPNKKVDNLKDQASRIAGQEWQEDLGLKNMTTREWDKALDMSQSGVTDEEIRRQIESNRKK